MEEALWLFYGLSLIGPVISAAVVAVLCVILPVFFAFKSSKKLGYFALSIAVVGVGLAANTYLIQPVLTFNNACNSGIGVRVFQSAKTNPSYILAHPRQSAIPRFSGYPGYTDATINSAILNVAHKKVGFVELEGPKNSPYFFSYIGAMDKYGDKSLESGYFKVAVAPRGSPNCRWLMPENVGSERYENYISHRAEYKKNELLGVTEKGKECIAIQHNKLSSADYLIDFSMGEHIGNSIYKDEIRVIDLASDKKALVGKATGYSHFSGNNIYAEIAFKIGNRKEAACPSPPLEGKIISKILGI